MASGKKKNVVTAYLNKVKIKKQDNLQQLLTKTYGAEGAKNLARAFEAIRIKKETDGVDERYDFIHSDFDFSMLMTAFQDGDIIKNTLNWLNSIRGNIGKTVLDAGCGSGIITCFLASILPESTFLAVDRSANAIAIAKQIRLNLGLENIVFMEGDAASLADKQFDTVLALRILDETTTAEDCRFQSFTQQLESRTRQYRTQAELLGKLTAPDGHLIILDMDKEDVSSLALLDLLRDSGLTMTDFRMLSAREGDMKEEDLYTAITLQKTKTPEARTDLLARWSSLYFHGIGNDGYRDAEADYMLELCASGARTGYVSHHPATNAKTGEFFICGYKGREDLFLLYQKNLSFCRLGVFPIAQKAEAEALLAADRQRDEEARFVTLDLKTEA
ncbi:MAG: methyltransferase domain-containing protein [Lachnospiraceae bacterium]|nr:methyltransferase domain-containing protein [Lachnospiraceae bacterium]